VTAASNEELVRRMFDTGPQFESALRSGADLSGHPWLSLFHPECVVEEMPDLPDARTFHGREGLLQFLRRGFEEVWEEWRFVPNEIIEGPDGVLAAVHNSGRSKTGVEVEMEIFQVFRFRDGMIIRVAGYLDRGEAFKAVGLGR
jgi:ketosteroid isomerase-like protein